MITITGKKPMPHPTSIAEGKQTSGAVDNAAWEKAAKAVANAKQRCNNKNCPDYPQYGGSGIMMLFANAKALVAAIGLPKQGHSLDRIDPHGHYEIGNVRWVTKAVQAANKKASTSNFHLSVGAQIVAAQEAIAFREHRRNTTVGWKWMLDAYDRGFLSLQHGEWLANNLNCPGLIEASVDFNTSYDWTNPQPGYAHLPALSLPNARVRVRCAAAMQIKQPGKRGRLAGMETLSAEWNVPKSIWKAVVSLVDGGGAGIALVGRPTEKDLLGGWVEGASLGMASVLANANGLSTACYPVLRVNQMLKNIGGPASWDEIAHDLLDVQVLFVPDLCLDCGAWGDGASIHWHRVGDLLRWRSEAGHQTVVGVQNAAKLPSPVKEVILGTYQLLTMPKTPPHPRTEMEFSDICHEVPAGALTLRSMQEVPSLASLVGPSCFPDP